jgi:hypothetical protein
MTELKAQGAPDRDVGIFMSDTTRHLAVLETRLDTALQVLGELTRKLDQSMVTRNEFDLRVKIMEGQIDNVKKLAEDVASQIDWVKKGVLSAIGGVVLLIITRVASMPGVLK